MDSNIIYKKFKRQRLIYKILFYFLRVLVFIIIIYLLSKIFFKISNKNPKIDNLLDIKVNVMTKINFQINDEENKLINITGETAIIDSDKAEIINIIIKDSVSKSTISAKKGYLDNNNKSIILQEKPIVTILN